MSLLQTTNHMHDHITAYGLLTHAILQGWMQDTRFHQWRCQGSIRCCVQDVWKQQRWSQQAQDFGVDEFIGTVLVSSMVKTIIKVYMHRIDFEGSGMPMSMFGSSV